MIAAAAATPNASNVIPFPRAYTPTLAPRQSEDPPGSPARGRPLTREELGAIQSGAGYPLARWGLPTPEDNAELHPYRARGLYPDPGHYERMARRNPILAAGTTRVEYYVASLDWRILPPEGAGRAEKEFAELVFDDLDNIPGGLPTCIRGLCTAVQFGFSDQEEVWYDDGGWLGIADLVWIRPATVGSWIVDPSGQWHWMLQRSERGIVGVPRGKLLHYAWRGRTRAPEGEAAFRPLYYYDEAKRERMVGEALTFKRFGVGTLIFIPPPGGGADGDVGALEAIGQAWQAGQQAYLLLPDGWNYKIEHGGSQRPDATPTLQYLDHQATRVLDDVLSELGFARYGSYSAGVEMRLQSQRQLTGVCREMCKAIEQQVIARCARANGICLKTRRSGAARFKLPRVLVTGFEDQARLNSIIAAVTAKVLEGTDPDVRTAVKRATGVSA